MMTLLTNLEIIGTICYIAALLLALRLLRIHTWRKPAIVLAVGLLMLSALGASNITQWTGVSHHPDLFEDYIKVTIPLLWLLLIYAVIYERITDQFRPYRTMFESANVGVAVIEADGSLAKVNAELARILGAAPHKLEGRQKFEDFIDPDDYDWVMERRHTRLAGEEVPANCEMRIRNSQGQRCHVIVNVGMVPDTQRCVVTLQDVTEHHRTRRKADGLAAFRSAVLETANAWIMIVDRDGEIVVWNDGAECVTGYTTEEMVENGETWRILYDTDTASTVQKLVRALLNGGAPIRDYTNTVRTKSGAERTISWYANPVCDGDDEIVGVLAVGHDITERYQTAKAFERLAAEQRVLLDNVPVMIYWKDTEGRYIRVNKAFADTQGLAPDDIIGLTHEELHPEQARRLHEDERRVIETGKPVLGIVEKVETAKGERWHSDDKVPYYDELGNVCGIIGFTVDITAQRRAYEALVAAERDAAALASFREHIMQTANVWMSVHDAEGRITLWNREAEKISGYVAEEAVDHPGGMLDVLYPDPAYREHILQTMHALATGDNDATEFDSTIECKNGTHKTIAWHMTRLVGPDGNTVGVISIGSDVTSAKEAEARQSAGVRVLEVLNSSQGSSTMLHDIVATLRDFTGCDAIAIRLAQDGDFPYIESAGIDADALQSRMTLRVPRASSDEHTPSDSSYLLRSPYDRFVRGDFPEGAEWLTAGGTFWTNDIEHLQSESQYDLDKLHDVSCVAATSRSVAIVPLRFAGDIFGMLELGYNSAGTLSRELVEYLERLAYSIGVAVQRRRSEETIRRERDFSDSVVQNAQALMIALDKDGNTTLFSNVAQETTGYSPEDVLGRPPWEVMAPAASVERFARPFRDLLAGDYPNTFEQTLQCANGEERLVTWRGTALTDQYGQVWQVIAIGLDITAHRQLEGRIRQSQRMEAIATLAGGITHDFNNILHAVLSNIELMQLLGTLNDAQQAKASAIQEAVKHASQITRQLTAMAAPERPEMCSIDLHNCIDSVMGLLRGARDQRVELLKSFAPHLPPVMGDPTQLEQVIMNLCVNALHALQGAGRLQVETRVEAATAEVTSLHPGLHYGAEYVRLDVIDNGIGMSAETMAQIFDPFFTTREHEGGTGLGLAIVYGIINAHNGAIAVNSEIDKGTIFTVYLPVAQDEVSELHQPETAIEIGSETVMLVEDNESVRENLKQLLSNIGYRVYETANGREAVEAANALGDTVDLYILDINMPEMNGIEAFERIHKMYPNAHGVLMTGFVSEEVRAEDLPEGILAILRKPFTIRQLSQCLRTSLGEELN